MSHERARSFFAVAFSVEFRIDSVNSNGVLPYGRGILVLAPHESHESLLEQSLSWSLHLELCRSGSHAGCKHASCTARRRGVRFTVHPPSITTRGTAKHLIESGPSRRGSVNLFEYAIVHTFGPQHTAPSIRVLSSSFLGARQPRKEGNAAYRGVTRKRVEPSLYLDCIYTQRHCKLSSALSDLLLGGNVL